MYRNIAHHAKIGYNDAIAMKPRRSKIKSLPQIIAVARCAKRAKKDDDVMFPRPLADTNWCGAFSFFTVRA